MSNESQLRLKAEYSIVAYDADSIELRSGSWNPRSVTLTDETHKGALLPVLLKLQQGDDPGTVAKETGIRRSEVESILDSLTEAGVLADTQTGILNDILDRQISMRMLEEPRSEQIILIGDDTITNGIADQIGQAFPKRISKVPLSSEKGIRLSHLGGGEFTDGLSREKIFEEFAAWKDSIVVCALQNPNPATFRNVDEIAQGVGFTWIHGTVDGPYIFIGPTIIPHRSANYGDLETRVMMNMHELASYQRYKTALALGKVYSNQQQSLFTPLLGVLASHLSMEIVNWMETGANFTVNKVLGIYLPTMEIAYHEILPVPGRSPASAQPDKDTDSLYFDVREWLDEQEER